MRVVIVEDEPLLRVAISDALRKEGWIVDVAEDGEKGARIFQQGRHEVVLSDLVMPRMDGMDLLQRVRQKTAMPVIFLTSKDDEIDEVLGLRMGADDYVKKPFSQRLLVERIRALLRRQDAVSGDIEIAVSQISDRYGPGPAAKVTTNV